MKEEEWMEEERGRQDKEGGELQGKGTVREEDKRESRRNARKRKERKTRKGVGEIQGRGKRG